MIKNSKNYKLIRGFTLIELLIVMMIISLMAVISLFALKGAKESGRDAKRKADLETIRSGLELYKADCNRYPPSLTAGSSLTGSACVPANTNVYIQTVPDDSMSGRDYPYTPSGAPPITYTLCAALEGGSGSATGCGSCGATCNYKVTNP